MLLLLLFSNLGQWLLEADVDFRGIWIWVFWPDPVLTFRKLRIRIRNPVFQPPSFSTYKGKEFLSQYLPEIDFLTSTIQFIFLSDHLNISYYIMIDLRYRLFINLIYNIFFFYFSFWKTDNKLHETNDNMVLIEL